MVAKPHEMTRNKLRTFYIFSCLFNKWKKKMQKEKKILMKKGRINTFINMPIYINVYKNVKKIVKKRITCFWWFDEVSKKFHVVLPGSDWFLHMAASSSNSTVLLSYSMLAFIANSFRLFRVIPLGLGQSVQYFMNNFFNTDVLYVYNLPYVHHIHSVKKNPLNAKSWIG